MGEAAEDLLDGTCCQFCGVWNDEILELAAEIGEGAELPVWEPPGFPWTCAGCREES